MDRRTAHRPQPLARASQSTEYPPSLDWRQTSRHDAWHLSHWRQGLGENGRSNLRRSNRDRGLLPIAASEHRALWPGPDRARERTHRALAKREDAID